MNNNRIRTIGIIIAAILGLAALLYLGGLVCQLLTEYQIWLASGGMQGDTRIGDIRLAPLSCWRQALTLSGLKYTGLVAPIGGSAYTLVRLYDRFGSRDFDDRNFSRSQRGTYGTAGWMGERELRTVLEVASPQKARGIILGQNDRGSVICLPEDTRLNKHIAVFGASGTMKSRGVIRPALFQSIRRGESVVVTDPKSEIYADTVELFRKNGYTVRIYNLLQPKLSDSWNCMFDLGGDTLMAQVLTDVIIPARAPYSLFSQASDTVRAGVVLGLGTRLQVLQSEAVRSITRQSDIDLALPGQTRCAYYIILDDQNSSLEFLSSLFFAFLFIKLVRYADSTPEQRCPVPVNIVLDEMNNIGVIPDFSRRLSTILLSQLQDFLHHRGIVVQVDGGLIPPNVDEQNGFGIFERNKILVAQIAGFAANQVGGPAALHFLSKSAGASIGSRVI